ncbi:MAG TPA: hypothetical protein V6D03_16255 [Candidatus Caenarcaniphilales bacterium]
MSAPIACTKILMPPPNAEPAIELYSLPVVAQTVGLFKQTPVSVVNAALTLS